MVKKALSQVSVNHSNGHLVKLYATELNLFYGKYSFALHNLWLFLKLVERGSFMVWEINMGVSPSLEFDNIMFINCLGYDFYIYGAFEFLCISIANL